MNRRFFLAATMSAAASLLCTGHTPFRQWGVYRRRHLLILTSREDAPSYPMGKVVAEFLAEYLPTSAARVTRAPSLERFASLIATDQLEVGLIAADLAAALHAGAPPFESFGPTAITTLFDFGSHLLISRADFPDRHAYAVTRALEEGRAGLETAGLATGGHASPTPPLHPGAAAYRAGHPAPEDGPRASGPAGDAEERSIE